MLLAGFKGYSQKHNDRTTVNCSGLRSLSAQAFLTLQGHTQHALIRKADLLKYDLQVCLNDSSLKIVGFGAGYDCHSRSLLDFFSRTYLGDSIKAGDPFIKGIWTGDTFVIDCINVEKEGKRYLIPALQFKIY